MCAAGDDRQTLDDVRREAARAGERQMITASPIEDQKSLGSRSRSSPTHELLELSPARFIRGFELERRH